MRRLPNQIASVLLADRDPAESRGALSEPRFTLAQMTDYWQQRFPGDPSPQHSLPIPLAAASRLPRNGDHADYCNIQWQALLAGDLDAPPSSDMARSEAMSQGLRPLRSIARRGQKSYHFLSIAETVVLSTGAPMAQATLILLSRGDSGIGVLTKSSLFCRNMVVHWTSGAEEERCTGAESSCWQS